MRWFWLVPLALGFALMAEVAGVLLTEPVPSPYLVAVLTLQMIPRLTRIVLVGGVGFTLISLGVYKLTRPRAGIAR